MKRTPTMLKPSEPFAVVAGVGLELPDVEAATRYDGSPTLKVGGAVGSGTGAVIRRQLLGCGQGFPLRAHVEAAVIPSPVPATSHAACGFPALRAPASVRTKGYETVPGGRLPRA
jgi:hypothetical protein